MLSASAPALGTTGQIRKPDLKASVGDGTKVPKNGGTTVHQGVEQTVIPRPSLHIPTPKVVPVQNYDGTKLVDRDAGPNTDPQVHYCTICSDNAVIKDATKRERLTDDVC